MSLLDIVPSTPRNPFARGALLPAVVETRNSLYTVTEHAVMVDLPPTVTVSCIKGTFEGESWNLPASEVTLTRAFFIAGQLRTTAPVKVNGYPVETW